MHHRCFALGLALLALVAMAQAKPLATYAAKLSGTASVPPIKSSASGSIKVIINDATHALATFQFKSVDEAFMAHIHSGNATSNGLPVVWGFNSTLAGQRQPLSGTFKGAFSFHPATGNVAAHLASGNAYFNVHTTSHPAGEIRGQLVKARS